MSFNLFRTKVFQVNTMFFGHCVDAKVLFTVKFSAVPCVIFIGELDTNKAFDFISSTYRSQIKEIYQHSYFDHDKKEFFFNNSLVVLKNKRIIDLANNYCQVLHSKDQYDWGRTMINELSVFHTIGDVNKSIGFVRSPGNIEQGMTNKEF